MSARRPAPNPDLPFLREALRLARRGRGTTAPNPMVGALLVRGKRILGRGWHRVAGGPHAEVEALRDAARRGHSARGATLYVTLEPCSTHGRTPPCTQALLAAGVRRVVAAATDPNPAHAGRGFRLLRRAGLEVQHGLLAPEASRLNEAFNHWMVHRTPFVTVKSAMTLDGRIATAAGESKWITGPRARAEGQRLRQEAGAILVGVNTVLADNPSLTRRPARGRRIPPAGPPLRRVILDSLARTPPAARVLTDGAAPTVIVVTRAAPARRVAALARRVTVWTAPAAARRAGTPGRPGVNLSWVLRRLGREGVTQLLVEGGGEVNASFLLGGLAQRVAFFYAPKVLGGRTARRAVAGPGARSRAQMPALHEVSWRRLGGDWLLTALVKRP